MRSSILALVAVSGLASVASAQTAGSFVLNDGLFRYTETTQTAGSGRTGTGNGSANFGLAGTTATAVNADNLFQNWWWYRSAGDTREFALSNQTSSTQISPNTVALVYSEPIGGSTAGAGLRFSFVYTLNQISPTQAAVTINWNIDNLTNDPQPVSFFAYSDSDLGTGFPGASASDDFGSYVTGTGLNYYRNDNSTTDTANFFTMGADLRLNDRWQIGPFSGTGSPRTLLGGNTVIDNMGNVDTAAGAADNAAAFQWDLNIPAGGSLGGRVTKGYNYVIPAPGTVALLGLGGLLAARRRR